MRFYIKLSLYNKRKVLRRAENIIHAYKNLSSQESLNMYDTITNP